MFGRIAVLFTILVLVLTGCAPAAAPTQAPAAPAAAEPTAAPAAPAAADKGSLAVILTGPWDDNSWNEAGYAAAQELGKQIGRAHV